VHNIADRIDACFAAEIPNGFNKVPSGSVIRRSRALCKTASDRDGDEDRHDDGEQRIERRSEAVSEKFWNTIVPALGAFESGGRYPEKQANGRANANAAGTGNSVSNCSSIFTPGKKPADTRQNIRKIAIGTFTLLKNAGHGDLDALIHSEKTGNITPQNTASRTPADQVLNMKLLSRETIDSI